MKRKYTKYQKAIPEEQREKLRNYLSAVNAEMMAREAGLTRKDLEKYIRGTIIDPVTLDKAHKIFLVAKEEYTKRQQVAQLVNSL